MLRCKFIVFILPLVFCCSLLCAAQNADSILALHTKALGDVKSVRSVYIEQDVKAVGMTFQIITYVEKGRTYFFKGKMPIVGWIVQYAHDSTGWVARGKEGKMEVSKMSRGMVDSLVHLEGNFGMLAGEGDKAVVAGEEKYDGEQCWGIKVTDGQGEVTTYYLSKATGLLRGMRSGQMKTTMRDYRTVNGVKFSYETKIRMGGMISATRKVTKLQVNAPVDEKLFEVPR